MPARIEVSGATIAFDDTGRGAPVLLLHGYPSTRHLWSRVAPSLVEAGHRVIVPDLVGYGASDVPAGVRIDMASQARWLLQLLDALGVARAAVLAHDVGSAAAQLMVASAPERVRALAVLDGVYGVEWAMEFVASIQAWDPADARRLHPVLARRLGKTAALREMLAAYEGEAGGLRLIRAARDLDPSQTAHVADALRSAGVPALVVWGERDAYLPIDTVARPLAELLSAPLVLVPGGHFTPLDCPAEVAAALREFLAGLPAGG
jgi:pimeloyl-ACP methyl ester carboxylesterase